MQKFDKNSFSLVGKVVVPMAKAFLVLMLYVNSGMGAAMAGEINTTWFGIAMEGYDPVSYFTEGQPQKGTKEFSYQWKDATWHFSSAKNRDLFASNPEAYAPQYGAHCANGLSLGHKVSGDPHLWRMIDGKLYLYFAERGRKRWSSNTDQWIQDANGHWTVLRDE